MVHYASERPGTENSGCLSVALNVARCPARHNVAPNPYAAIASDRLQKRCPTGVGSAHRKGCKEGLTQHRSATVGAAAGGLWPLAAILSDK